MKAISRLRTLGTTLSAVVVSAISLAQGPNCASSDPFCTGSTETFPAGVGVTDAMTSEPGNNYGCLGSAPNPAWYYMEVDSGGDLEITMSNSNNLDIDFALWGPFPSYAAAMGNCGSLGSPYDCSYSTTATEVAYIASTNPGDVWILLVTNFSNNPTDISFTNTSGSATTDCSIVTPCNMSFLQVNVGACNPGTGTYDVTGWVDFTDPPASGQLIIEDCNGNQDVYNAPFGVTQNYTISGLTADGLPCDITAWFTADPACTINLNYNAPPPCAPPCNMDFLQVNIGACNTATQTYDLDGWVDFSNPPSSGQLIIEDCWGNQDVYNAPFGATQTWNLSGLPADGAGCDVTVWFTADPSCTINLSYTAPAGCACGADAGTYTDNITGNSNTNWVLCYLDQIDIVSNGDDTEPPDQLDPFGPPYDPGIWFLVYSCPPTVFPPNDINTDPCLLGVFSTTDGSMSDINTGGINTTYYYVPITMYSMSTGIYSYFPPPDNCYDLGPVYPVTYLPEITYTDNMTCGVGWDITITGGHPNMFGTNFTLSNLVPATASFSTTSLPDGGTVTITGLNDGDMISFDVVDQNGCPITINLGPFVDLPTADAGPDDTICNSLSYTLQAVPSLGTGVWTGPGTFAPSANNPNATVTVAAAGTYTFTWTETNTPGCTDFDDVNISFSNLSHTTVDVNPTCGNPDGSITINDAGGVAPLTYSIDNGVTNVGTNVFNGLVSGTYNIVVTDALGCTSTSVVNLTDIGGPTFTTTFTDPLCNGSCDGTITFNVVGGTTPILYSTDGGGTFLPANPVTGLCGGTYNLVIQDNNGCQATGTETLTDPPALSYTATTVDLTCYQDGTGEIDITGSGGTSPLQYSITGGAPYSGSGLFTGLAAGTYNIEVIDANGCTVTGTETLTEPTQLTLTFSTFPETCAGSCDGSATAIPAGGVLPYTYTWSGGTGGPTDPATSGLCTGNYNLTVTDGNNCTVDTLSWAISGPIAVTVDNIVVTDESCNASCDGAIDATVSGGTIPYTFAWTGPGGPYGTEDITNLCAGTYDFTVTDDNGCAATGQGIVGSPTPVTLTVSPDTTICIGGTATLTATPGGGTPGYTYLWDDPLNSTTATITVTPAVNTTYTCIITDNNGCVSAPASVDVTLNPPLDVTALSDQTICEGDAANITANASGGDGGPYTYSWDNGAGVTQSPTVSPATTTTYTVTVTDGCETPSATDAVTITVEPLPVPAFVVDNASGCAPVTVTFTDNTVPAGTTCLWDFGDGNTSTSCGSATYTYNTPGCYTVTLTLTSANGCVGSTTIVDMVCVYANPVANFTFGPQPTTVLDADISFVDQSTSNVAGWSWDFAGLGTSVAQNPTFSFPNDVPGTYLVCLDVVTAEGCTDDICKTVIIGEDLTVYVPNCITLDGDGINDYFYPVVHGIDPTDYVLYVFDRWGELIFESHHPDIWWDGTYKGTTVQEDVYVWKLHVKDVDNAETYEYYGHVTVLK